MMSPVEVGSNQMITGVLSVKDYEEEEPLPPLKIEDFKVPDFQLQPEVRNYINKLKMKFNTVTEEFL